VRLPLQLAYDAVARIARAATAIAPAGDSKLLTALADRRGIVERYRAWAATGRDVTRPLLWMHAPSVGEGLKARPVLQRMRQRRPAVQLAYTHFSPSAASFARGLDVDFRDYLVLDTRRDTAAAIDALKPTALVFSKLDVWPNLVNAARHRGVRLALISATLAPDSSRRSGVARALLRDAYASLDAVGAIDTADADRLIALGVRRAVIEVTGDAGYDQVWDRAASVRRDQPPIGALVSERPTIVAGSTWPADETVLLGAFAQLRRSTPDLRLIIAPHEPSAAHVLPLLEWAAREHITAVMLSDPRSDAADVVVVDRVGVLGDLYALAGVAYVGGGFHGAGLHSVIEPAAFGAPVVFGPRHQMSRDALLLTASGGGLSVSDERAFVTALSRWLKNPDARTAAGDCARQVVRAGLGAADRSFAIVDKVLRE
jgi:3-deoxy-D-manno-octulosonic-acid transferase